MNVQNDTFAKFWYITVQTVIILTECIILLFIHYIFVYCEFIVEKIMWDHVDREQHKGKLCLTYLLYSRVCFQLLHFSFS